MFADILGKTSNNRDIKLRIHKSPSGQLKGNNAKDVINNFPVTLKGSDLIGSKAFFEPKLKNNNCDDLNIGEKQVDSKKVDMFTKLDPVSRFSKLKQVNALHEM